ncbi:LysR family transcriptional regulator [Hansschlegelia beijingensis]|uniref:DNA-binding transcriptional LysR family regulator n=1 Tax=Hansschlegelia beijingensis TaxID=1133344 RepID=A0A7W6D1L3_9HYPH|nr:LysR family transcriptional regulator [Hansschlegelia beijingensis]MBB3972720.1 DNA-binding transcriptional LysR family regulator [Hansschlegelia beijingensis]
MADLFRSLSWDDLRLVKAIAEARGMPGAAAALGLNHSTVFRRLGQIETTLGVTLFERRRNGYGLTPAGEEMTRLAAEVEDRIAAFSRRIEGRAISPAGDLRVATNDTLLIHLLTPLFARFQQACPDIRLDVVIGNPALNLSKRDADVAIRATDSPPDNLVGRRVARIAWALYGRAADFPDPDALPDLAALKMRPWVSLGEELTGLKVVRFARENIPEARLRYRTNTVLGLAEAVEAGLGVGHIPCFIAETRPALIRLAPPDPAFAADLWILTHPDLRQSPRVRAFMDLMGAELAAARPLLEGAGLPDGGSAGTD